MKAFLKYNGRIYTQCSDCSEHLEKVGLIKAMAESDTITIYELVPPHTLQDCRDEVKDRHKRN